MNDKCFNHRCQGRAIHHEIVRSCVSQWVHQVGAGPRSGKTAEQTAQWKSTKSRDRRSVLHLHRVCDPVDPTPDLTILPCSGQDSTRFHLKRLEIDPLSQLNQFTLGNCVNLSEPLQMGISHNWEFQIFNQFPLFFHFYKFLSFIYTSHLSLCKS